MKIFICHTVVETRENQNYFCSLCFCLRPEKIAESPETMQRP